jgi:hypothetical protein
MSEKIKQDIRNHIGKITANKLFDFGKKKGKSLIPVVLSPSWIGTSLWVMRQEADPRLEAYVTKMSNPNSKSSKYNPVDELSRDFDVQTKVLPEDWREDHGYFEVENFTSRGENGVVSGYAQDIGPIKFDALLWLYFTELGMVFFPKTAKTEILCESQWVLVNNEARMMGSIMPIKRAKNAK